MIAGKLRMIVILAAGAVLGGAFTSVRADENADPAALARALTGAQATLEVGLKASEHAGTPISAKFEIDDGKLQLSVYLLDGSEFVEVIADPKTGAVIKTEKITESDDLKDASEQNAAMAKASVTLLAAADIAVKTNVGFRTVSIEPRLQGGQAVAEVTLLQGAVFKKTVQKLY
jgi:hypothetical protein